MGYRLPPPDIVRALDAAPTPAIVPSPDLASVALVAHQLHPPVSRLAEPFLRLAGVRIDPVRGCRQRVGVLTGVMIVGVDDGKTVPLDVPAGMPIGMPVWSHDSSRIGFSVEADDCVELWLADPVTGETRQIPGVKLNDVLTGGPAFSWSRDSRRLLAVTVPPARGSAPGAPREPRIEEVSGKRTQMATFQDLLTSEADEALFEHYATAQLVSIDADTATLTPVGDPGLYLRQRRSPGGRYRLVTRLHRPFSYRVPFAYFTRTVEVWTAEGLPVATVASLPVSDEVPRQGVPTGPRAVTWQEKRDATLVWAEALDGGDPTAAAEHRDRLMRLDAPFDGEPAEVLRLTHRYSGMQFTDEHDVVWISEHDRDRRWRTVSAVDLAGVGSRRTLFDLSQHDAYRDPGRAVHDHKPDGEYVILQDGDAVYLSGAGATPRGLRPFLDRFDTSTLQSERLWRCDEESHETFVGFVARTRNRILTVRQAITEPPNLFVVDLDTGERRQLTRFEDPHPELTGASKRLVSYSRDDGVELSATLHLPPGYTAGERVPVLVWAYPMDYGDADTAGQVRGTDKAFTRLEGASPLWFLLRGWAVLMNATMPVVGDPETKNDTFVEQVVASATAAIDMLDEAGVVDRDRVVVSGHSYGGFMTASLLAHTDLFAAGIARSGAYNRSLTPFGFQTERRSYWEVPHIYHRVSPFGYADRITAPILLIHGEEDNNSGTFPVQSERLFQAISGHGGTARLVMLPHESHGYRGRESVLHVIAEMLDWAERWTAVSSGAPAAAVSTT